MKRIFTYCVLLGLQFFLFKNVALAQPDITLSTNAVASSSLTQGTIDNIVYVGQMSVSTQAVVVNSVQVTLSGTHDANDLELVRVYFNATAPSISGATLLNYVSTPFAAPHTYNITGLGRPMAAGSSGYFIIAVDVSATATHGNTVKVNGATNPLVFGFSTAPNITNNQTDAAGTKTIQAADITLSTNAVASSSLTQGTIDNIVYVGQMSVSTQAVVVNSVQVTLSGTHDANDLELVRVYFNATAPSISGATLLNYVSTPFAAPHTYNITGLGRPMAAGSSGYFIIAVDVSATATHGNTVKVNGATNPLVFGFSTAPNITNNQTDAAGTQVIQGAVVTLTSSSISPSVMSLGSNNNVIYAVQMDVASQNATATSVQVTLSGTHDADDLTSLAVYFNASAPTFAGSSFVNSATPSFAAPHTYNITGFSRTITAGNSGYFLVVVNVSGTATMGNTVKVNGATNPLVFGFSTGVAVNNGQTDASGTQHISAVLPVTLSSFTAKGLNNSVQLNWKTTTEIDNAYFDIEHSYNGIDFTGVGRIDSKGTTSTEQQYSFTHQSPKQGNNFYRLKQVDGNGTYKYSGIVQVIFNSKRGLFVQVFSNPVKNSLRLSVSSAESALINIQLADASGRMMLHEVKSIQKGNNNLQLNVGRFTNGLYYLFIFDEKNNQISTEKIAIQN
jgi:hypothetical protein